MSFILGLRYKLGLIPKWQKWQEAYKDDVTVKPPLI